MSNQSTEARGVRPGVLLMVSLAMGSCLAMVWFHYHFNAEKPVVEQSAAPEVAQASPPVAAAPSVKPVVAGSAAAPIFVSPPAVVPPPKDEIPMVASSLETDGGIKVFKATLVRGGMAVDVRYQIVNTNKVHQLAEATPPAYLANVATGFQVSVTPPQVKNMKPQQRARSALMMNQATGFPPTSEKMCADGNVCSVLVPNPDGVFQRGNQVYLMVQGLQSAAVSME